MSRQATFGHSQVDFRLWPICQKFHGRYIQLTGDLARLADPSDPSGFEAFFYTVEERMQAATITIVFTATYLDHFIYLYGSTHLGIEDYEKEFDRLSLRAKWLNVPQRIHGKIIPEKSKAIEMLGNLVQVRHKIVHSKIFDMGREVIPAVEKTQSLAKLTHECAHDALDTAKSLMVELGKIDTRATFQKFLGDFLAG